MVVVLLLLVLVLIGVLAPRLGADTTDSRNEAARPEHGWHPLNTNH
jgi:hypothetical protein